MPFNALSFTAVALACLMLGSFNRRGQARKIMLAAGLVILLQTVDLGVLSLVKEHRALVPLVYVVSLGPLLVSLFLMTFRGEPAVHALRARLHRPKKAPLPAAGGAA
jgi:lipopolysaccharide export system permease protein